MHILEALEHLVADVLLVDVLKDVSSNNSVEVCVHKIEDKIYVAIVFSANYILQSNDVFMTD